MRKIFFLVVFTVLFNSLSQAQIINYRNTDPRYIENGDEVPNRTYADQPYVIVCDDEAGYAL